MLDENHMSKEWEQLWKDLDQTGDKTSFHQEKDKSGSIRSADMKNVKTGDFGVGAMMIGNYKDPIQGFQAEIRSGAGHIEFSPAAMQGANMDFTKIGAERRRALKEIAKVNEATIATHAHPGITGMSGFNQENYSFSEESRKRGMDEVRKAIDFAADVCNGGSVTFHAGEYIRPLADQKWGAEFEKSPDEKNEIILAAIDKSSEQLIRESILRPRDKIFVPVPERGSKERVKELGVEIPKYVERGGEVSVKEFNSIREYAAYLYKEDYSFKEELKKKGITSPVEFSKKVEEERKRQKKDYYGEIKDYTVLELANKRRFVDNMRGELVNRYYQQMVNVARQETDFSKIANAYKTAQKLFEKGEKKIYVAKEDQRIDEDQLVITEETYNSMPGNIKKYYSQADKESIKNTRVNNFYQGYVKYSEAGRRLNETYGSKASLQASTKEQLEKVSEKNIDSISEHALTKAKESYVNLALEAYDKTRELKKKNPNAKPIYLAIENLFPERYGSHPEELLKIIKTAQKDMATVLHKKGKTESEAKKIAQQTIKATFDTGHLHMWKKYFRRKPGESDEERDKSFNKWALKQTQKLVDEGVIGNIHLADNFGYDDEHLSPGQGNVPIKEYMKMFDKAIGDKKIVGKVAVEGGFDEGQRGVHEAWKSTGVQIFRSVAATERWINPGDDFGSDYRGYSFTRMQDNYLGQSHKPYFIFGKYSPDQEEWAPWSETRLE
jgi:hypothetical protein